MMRSEKLGYNAPIEVYDNKYYRYADPDYSIRGISLSEEDYELVEKVVNLIGEVGESTVTAELGKVLSQLKNKLMFRFRNKTRETFRIIILITFCWCFRQESNLRPSRS